MADQSKTGVKSATYVNIDKICLVMDVGQEIDISPMIAEFNMYQSLFDPFVRCTCILSDATSLFSLMDQFKGRQPGFTGLEVLLIKFTSTFPSENKRYKEHAFIINNVSNQHRESERSELLVLEAISFEAYATIDKRISRAYGYTSKRAKRTVDKYIKSIVDEFLYNKLVKTAYKNLQSVSSVAVEKRNTYSPTNSLVQYVIPSLNPIDAIYTLMGEADNTSDTSLFSFYEDSNGFNFADMTTLIGEKKHKNIYLYEPSNLEGSKNMNADMFKIQTYSVVKSMDFLEAKSSGLFKAKTINLDILRKNKKEVIYDYAISGPRFSKLNDGNLAHRHLISGFAEADSSVRLRTTRFNHSSHEFFTGPGKENPMPTISPLLEAKRKSYEEHISNIMLNVTVPGNSELNVGEKLGIVIPKASGLGNPKLQQEDKYTSGIYLVTKLRHRIKQDQMFTDLELSKDGESTLSYNTSDINKQVR